MKPFPVLAFLVAAACSSPAQGPADTVFHNARIVTLDDAVPEASWLAVRGDRIAAVGDSAAVASLIGEGTEVVDLGGRLVIPGFIEGHGHFTGVGRARMILDLTKARNWSDIVAQVDSAVAVAPPGAWIVGRGWHQEKWDETPEGAIDGVPTHQSLSVVSPDNPVYLTHASGHASFVNGEALRLAGISAETPDPAGGEIVHDTRGEASGLLRETAQGLVARALSAADQARTAEELAADERQTALLAARESVEKGVTSFQDAGVGFGTVDLYKSLVDEGVMPVRLYVMLRVPNEDIEARLDAYRMIGYGSNHLTVRSIKVSIDGALGSHGAWLLEPYSDKPESVGLNTVDLTSAARTAQIALAHDYQLNVHAIGDRANREVLDLFEEAFGGPDTADRRWRIEHAQHLHPHDIPRFGELHVIAAMQGIHATSDGPWVLGKLGEQRAHEGSHVWKSLIDTGAVVSNGTDAPVEDLDPIPSYYATVSRRLNDGSVYYGEQRLDRVTALRTYTIDNAYAAFEEDVKGTLSPGKLADFVVLSRDILTVPEEEILDARVLRTVIGGKTVFERAE